ncbi:MAG: 2-phospho-L-lactate transferase [Pseudomonadales bacterium]|jgi:LPPG:FO 2-phospho-L-lactate transferase|nr:2-phospho-L-lactate transferase [Pseudomonadales bacterium]MDP6470630.1 2-phospho-L-lactate transferase [Pseudomonadales bacterium]MDP6828515.1 2-phospho-L-lactate transferase [Pseudomonadales bacterium]|tara:strand:+ start:678 stop:1610 length:933 start_codon:yes stop_codon:yes gene_type:complete
MGRYLAITGGVGGAKLALGLSKLLGPDDVLFAVNTGDDFEHLGFDISPDVDTLTYTLADEVNQDTGWGRAGESWQFIDALAQFGGETWFRLGDRDLALHVTRTRLLAEGRTLTEATRTITRALGIWHTLVPMSDDSVRTIVHTPDGPLAFQHYFVRDRCEPAVTGFEFQGIDDAVPNPEILACLRDCNAVIICPSNPFVSVDPMLDIPGMRDAIRASGAPVVAVSPIVGGLAIKGPTAKMMKELDVPATAEQVATHYGDLLTGFLLDEQDAGLHGALPVTTSVAHSVMHTLEDKIQLARATLRFVDTLKA